MVDRGDGLGEAQIRKSVQLIGLRYRIIEEAAFSPQRFKIRFEALSVRDADVGWVTPPFQSQLAPDCALKIGGSTLRLQHGNSADCEKHLDSGVAIRQRI